MKTDQTHSACVKEWLKLYIPYAIGSSSAIGGEGRVMKVIAKFLTGYCDIISVKMSEFRRNILNF